MSSADTFELRIERLDGSLFDLVTSQSTDKDRGSWLTLQRAVRTAKPSYTYLEIGSYLGGSLQQYLQDPRCATVYSIDDRTVDLRHHVNSTEGMLENLRAAGAATDKLTCFDRDASLVPAGAITRPPDICFIDGRHTDEAVTSDFSFCLRVCAPDAVIYFHDAGRTRAGIASCLARLRRQGRPFVAYKLPGETFVVGLLTSPLCADPRVRASAAATHGVVWLRTSGVVNRLRRHTPGALRPALSSVRRRCFGTAGR